jgi:hypothetical protein
MHSAVTAGVMWSVTSWRGANFRHAVFLCVGVSMIQIDPVGLRRKNFTARNQRACKLRDPGYARAARCARSSSAAFRTT